MTKIASVCMGANPRGKEENIAAMQLYAEQAIGEGVDLLVFPEMVVSGYGTKRMSEFCGEDRVAYTEYAELIPEGDTVHFSPG